LLLSHEAAPLILLLASLGIGSAQESSSAKRVLLEGKQLFLQGDYRGATTALRRALPRLENRGDRIDARLTLASIYQAQGNADEAIIELQWAIAEEARLELDPDLYSPKTRRLFQEARQGGIERFLSARESFMKGRLAVALEEFELARLLLQTQGSEADLRYVLDALLSSALIHQQLGRLPECRQAFRETLALRPELELDSDLYSPSTTKIFHEVREELAVMRTAQSARALYQQARARANEAGAEADTAGPLPEALKLAEGAEGMWTGGDYAAARRNFEQAAAIMEQAWPASETVESADEGNETLAPRAAAETGGGAASPPLSSELLPPPGPVRIPANSRHAFPVERVNPSYPAFAMRARVEGLVVLDVVVDEEGNPESVRAISAPMVFESVAEKAVKEWRWRPYLLDGKAVSFKVLVTVQFQLSERR